MVRLELTTEQTATVRYYLRDALIAARIREQSARDELDSCDPGSELASCQEALVQAYHLQAENLRDTLQAVLNNAVYF